MSADLIGKPIPPFALSDDQGATIAPATLAGAWTVLYAYPRDATPGCNTEGIIRFAKHGFPAPLP
jgi:peroxiredoxin Q/BCP